MSWILPGATEASIVPAAHLFHGDPPPPAAIPGHTPIDRRPLEVAIPVEVRSSPVIIEGRAWSSNDVVVAAVGNDPVQPVSKISDSRQWFHEVHLHPEVPTDVAFIQKGAPVDTEVQGRISWVPLSMYHNESIGIRVGDSVKLQASTGYPEGAISIDVDGNGVIDYKGDAEEVFTVVYDSEGVYQARAYDADGQQIGSATITVTNVKLPDAIACQVGFTRTIDIHTGLFAPADIEVVVVGETADGDRRVDLRPIQAVDNHYRVELTSKHLGDAVLQVLHQDDGRILAHRKVDSFVLDKQNMQDMVINAQERNMGGLVTMRPWIPDLQMEWEVFANTSSFAGGAKILSISTNDLQPYHDSEAGIMIADIPVELFIPPGETSHCVRAHFTQQNIQWVEVGNTGNINNRGCEVEVDVSRIWAGSPDETGLQTGFIRARRVSDDERDKQHDIRIVKGEGSTSEHGAGDPVFTNGGRDRIRARPDGFTCNTKDWQEFNITVRGNTGKYHIQIKNTRFRDRLQTQHVDITEFPDRLRLNHTRSVTIRAGAGTVRARMELVRTDGGQSGEAIWVRTGNPAFEGQIRDGFHRESLRATAITQNDDMMLARVYLLGTRNAESEFAEPLTSSKNFEIVERLVIHETAEEAPDGTADDRLTVGVGEKIDFDLGVVADYTIVNDGNIDSGRGSTFSVTAGPEDGDSLRVVVRYDDENTDRTVDFTVIAPTGIGYEYKPNSDIAVAPGLIGCRYEVIPSWYPMNVSFFAIEIREVSTGGTGPKPQTSPSVDDNYFNQGFSLDHNASASWSEINRANIEEKPDLVGYVPPETSGTTFDPKKHWPDTGLPEKGLPHVLIWPIPHEYRIKGGGNPVFDAGIETQQRFVIDSEGNLTVSKRGDFGTVVRTRNRETGQYK